ncbi:MAG: para-aminobenzoate synthetase component II [Alphaproteobacteria bacterium]|nr:MAG: para-aminobenzoate synthetase component II [Caulobacteraceae bacterium]TPW08212.1 MAG: para-aminobenzoate synthetase component II [Alphaproteobacteria bacterium]
MTQTPHIVVIDNRDSFVFNLVRYLEELGCRTTVLDSQRSRVADVQLADPDGILLSPGPCTPNEAGISLDIVRAFSGRRPLLGVCLGHQTIAATYGWRIERARHPRYGQAIALDHEGVDLFAGLPSPLNVGLYHSLIAAPPVTPTRLMVNARSPEGEVMAVSDPERLIWGVQFHPESLLTCHGHRILDNYIKKLRV